MAQVTLGTIAGDGTRGLSDASTQSVATANATTRKLDGAMAEMLSAFEEQADHRLGDMRSALGRFGISLTTRADDVLTSASERCTTRRASGAAEAERVRSEQLAAYASSVSFQAAEMARQGNIAAARVRSAWGYVADVAAIVAELAVAALGPVILAACVGVGGPLGLALYCAGMIAKEVAGTLMGDVIRWKGGDGPSPFTRTYWEKSLGRYTANALFGMATCGIAGSGVEALKRIAALPPTRRIAVTVVGKATEGFAKQAFQARLDEQDLKGTDVAFATGEEVAAVGAESMLGETGAAFAAKLTSGLARETHDEHSTNDAQQRRMKAWRP